MTQPIRSLLAITASSLALIGCASLSSTPTYNTQEPAANQAATFIGEKSGKQLNGVDGIALTSCNVMFAISSSAHASTSAGLFADVGSKRTEASVSTHYSMEGLDNHTMQTITDKLCTRAEQKLIAAGYQLVTFDALKDIEAYRSLSQSGTATPYEIKKGSASGGSRYLVFARSGDSVWDQRYQTFGGSIAQGFKAVSGKSGESLELLLADSLDIAVARLNMTIDFAEMDSDGDGLRGILGGIASKNSANVSSKVMLSTSGGLEIRSGKQISCYKNLAGNRGCTPKGLTAFTNKVPISSTQPFYTAVTNATTVSDKAASAIVNTFAILGGSSTRSTSRYRVDVTPASYQAVQQPLTDGLVDMAIERSKAFR